MKGRVKGDEEGRAKEGGKEGEHERERKDM